MLTGLLKSLRSIGNPSSNVQPRRKSRFTNLLRYSKGALNAIGIMTSDNSSEPERPTFTHRRPNFCQQVYCESQSVQ